MPLSLTTWLRMLSTPEPPSAMPLNLTVRTWLAAEARSWLTAWMTEERGPNGKWVAGLGSSPTLASATERLQSVVRPADFSHAAWLATTTRVADRLRGDPAFLALVQAQGVTQSGDTVASFVRSIDVAWGSSAVRDPLLLAIHMAVHDVFGTPITPTDGATTFTRPLDTTALHDAEALYQQHRAAFHAYVQAQHAETQAYFAAHGYHPGETVTLFRGLSWQHLPDGVRPGGHTMRTTMLPLSSWTSNLAIARRFGQGRTGAAGAIVATTIPVEQIFSLAATGMGASTESEVVTIGHPSISHVLAWRQADQVRALASVNALMQFFAEAGTQRAALPTLFLDTADQVDWLHMAQTRLTIAAILRADTATLHALLRPQTTRAFPLHMVMPIRLANGRFDGSYGLGGGTPPPTPADHIPHDMSAFAHMTVTHQGKYGTTYQDTAGHLFHVAKAPDLATAHNEVGAFKVYEAAGAIPGLDIPHTAVLQDPNGDAYIIKQLDPAFQPQTGNYWGTSASSKARVDAKMLLGVDMLLGNRAVLGPNGTSFDNVRVDTAPNMGGKVMRMSARGAMALAGNGKPHSAWQPGAAWTEPWTLRQRMPKNGTTSSLPPAHSIFGKITDPQMGMMLAHLAATLDLHKVDAAWTQMGMSAAQRQANLAVLQDRLHTQLPQILQQLKYTGQGAPVAAAKPPPAPKVPTERALREAELKAEILQEHATQFRQSNTPVVAPYYMSPKMAVNHVARVQKQIQQAQAKADAAKATFDQMRTRYETAKNTTYDSKTASKTHDATIKLAWNKTATGKVLLGYAQQYGLAFVASRFFTNPQVTPTTTHATVRNIPFIDTKKVTAPGKATAKTPQGTSGTVGQVLQQILGYQTMQGVLAGTVPVTAGAQRTAGDDQFMKEMNKEAGFDGLPHLVNEAQMNFFTQSGEIEMFRGCNHGPRGEAFQSGEFYAGVGIHGNGTYTAGVTKTQTPIQAIQTAQGYTRLSSYQWSSTDPDPGVIFRLVAKGDAKLSTERALEAASKKFTAEINRLYQGRINAAATRADKQAQMQERDRLLAVFSDTGRVGLLLGYDGYYCTGADYYVMLNRTAMRVQGRMYSPTTILQDFPKDARIPPSQTG